MEFDEGVIKTTNYQGKVLIFKSDNTSDIFNYRPISIIQNDP